MSFLDTIVYAFLSYSHIWFLLASVMLLLRRRKFRAMPFSRERWFYHTVIAISLIVWTWNGLRPAPVLLEERVGLYWGIKHDNASWGIHTGGYREQPTIAYRGQASLAVQFQKTRGWIIFHHFPTAPSPDRYEAIEFYINKNDLIHDTLLVSLYGDGKVQYPSPEGIPVTGDYFCQAGNEEWICVRVPLIEFHLPSRGIIGIGIGKSNGVDEGTFYLDQVRLIEKP